MGDAMTEPVWEVLPPEEPSRPDTPRVPLTRRQRLAAAFAIALISDVLSVWLEFLPPVQWAVDAATAVTLFLLLGRQWIILPALAAEAVPGLAIMPAWVLVVGSVALWGTVKPFRRL